MCRPKLFRTLSTQHWDVASREMIKERKCVKKAGTCGNWCYYVSRASVYSPIIEYSTYFEDKLATSEIVVVPQHSMPPNKKIRRKRNYRH